MTQGTFRRKRLVGLKSCAKLSELEREGEGGRESLHLQVRCCVEFTFFGRHQTWWRARAGNLVFEPAQRALTRTRKHESEKVGERNGRTVASRWLSGRGGTRVGTSPTAARVRASGNE